MPTLRYDSEAGCIAPAATAGWSGRRWAARAAEHGPCRLLDDGPMQGKPVEVELVEGRPPKTIDLTYEDGGTLRYRLSEWNQEGMTAAYTFRYAV